MTEHKTSLKEAKAAFQEMLDAHAAKGAKDQEHDYSLGILGDYLSRMEAVEVELEIRARNMDSHYSKVTAEAREAEGGTVERARRDSICADALSRAGAYKEVLDVFKNA